MKENRSGPLPAIQGYRDLEVIFRSVRTTLLTGVRLDGNARMVLKTVTPGTTDSRARWRLQHEYSILRQLDGVEGVIRCGDLMSTSVGTALELEHVGTGDLRQLAGQVVPVTRVLEIGIQLAQAIERLHQRGVSHRDINPGNVLYHAGSGRVWMIDFGLSSTLGRDLAEIGNTRRMEGTVGYLSPEQTGRMNRSVDHRTDLYSLGATLYYLLVGRAPFDSRDEFELVHATVAVVPTSPSLVRPDVPLTLSRLVMKLLEKDAEDRYQEAHALAEDLGSCLDQWTSRGDIPEFPLGRSDRRGTFLISERVVGRSAEVNHLGKALDETIGGMPAVVAIQGPAGIGKSSLIRELMSRMSDGGLVAGGVCNDLERRPYGPILRALNTISDRVLLGSPERIDEYRRRYEDAVDGQGGLLMRLLPEVETYLGPQADVLDLPPSESEKRIRRMLVRLLRSYHGPGSELVLFFDDLQWVDPATFGVIEALLHNEEEGGPMLILSWRSEEVRAGHPLHGLMERHPEISSLTLEPLTPEDVALLLGESLDMSVEDVGPLARVVHGKTGGNTVFVRRFVADLHRNGIIVYDSSRRSWTWSLEDIDAMEPTPNVRALIRRHIGGLPREYRDVLSAAACVGRVVELHTLQAVARMTNRELVSGLRHLIDVGMLESVGASWSTVEAMVESMPSGGGAFPLQGLVRFSHDVVHLAASESVEQDEQMQYHARAGRLLLEAWRHRFESPFAPADQLNRAIPLLEGPEEILELANVNLEAGLNAAASAAYDTALHYLEQGILLMDDSHWQSNYELMFRLHLAAAESGLMCPARSMRSDYVEVAMDRASSLEDRVAIQRVRIRHHTSKYQFKQTVRLTLEALRWVGVDIPEKPSTAMVMWTVLRTRMRVWRMDADAMLRLPECENPEVVAALELMIDASAAAYYSEDTLLPIFLCKMLDLSVEYGMSPGTAFACGGHAFLRLVTSNDLEGALEWGDAADRILERYDAPLVATRTSLLTNGFVGMRTRPLASLIPIFSESAWQAREAGDAEYTALFHFNHSFMAFLSGVDLPTAAGILDADLKACEDVSQPQSANSIRVMRQAVDCLMGQAEDPTRLEGRFLSCDELKSEMEAGNDQSGLASLAFRSVFLSLLLQQDLSILLEQVDEAHRTLSAVPGSPDEAPIHFYSALAWCRQLRLEGRVGGRPRRRIKRSLKVVRRLSRDCSVNHAHKVRLIEAELASLRGDAHAAMRIHDDAIHLARASGMLHEEAICIHWAAESALRHGNHRAAVALVREARAAWEAYGCLPMLARVAALEARVVGSGAARITEVSRASLSRNSSDSSAAQMDSVALFRAARTISSEIDLDRLCTSLIRLAVQSAGATSGMLVLLDSEGRPFVAGRGETTSDGVEVEWTGDRERVAVEYSDPNVAPVVRYVIRRRGPLAIHDGEKDSRFFQTLADPPRSVLCVPAIKGTSTVGVMYLENRVARNAFTDDRHQLVSLLCSQAAVSIENARLYQDLQDSLDNQRALAEAYGRFMPLQFLDLLRKGSILDVQLGNEAARDVTIMFADIREFTGIAEALGPEATFALINRYLGKMEPAIYGNGGFVNQYLGDGIMAIFPGSADDALQASLAMLDGLNALNRMLSMEGLPEIRIGIGLNSGSLMLGVIGGADRMGRGCVGDVANVASRIEGMTKDYGVPLLIGESTYAALSWPEGLTIRSVDRVHPKGRAESITVFEVVEATRKVVVELEGEVT